MINIIKMNFYRMVRTKSTWIILACVIGFAALATFVSSVDLENSAGKPAASAEKGSEGGEVSLGIQINRPEADGPENRQMYLLDYLCADISSGVLLIFIGIFAVLFAHGEEKHGFIKNLIGKTRSRWNLYVAKSVVVFAFSAVCILIYSAAMLLFSQIWFPDVAFGLPILGRVAVYALIVLLLQGAFGCAAVFVATLSRSSAIGITVTIMASCGLIAILLSYVNKILPWLSINLMEYQIVPNVNRIMYDSGADLLWFAAAAGVVYTLLYNILGSILVEKRDVV